MNLNLQTLQALNKFRTKAIHDVTVDDVAETLNILDISADPNSMHKVVQILAADDDQQLIDWVLEPANQEKVLEAVKPAEQKLTIACPECNELALYRVTEIARTNPHVVCRFCSVMIPLE
jgi:predicted RNA-binding Zn-ribbon protein involved in translation (DUF1610 family)